MTSTILQRDALKTRRLGALAIVAIVGAAAPAALATTHNAATNFSPSVNPNAPWSFGQSPALGGVFTSFPASGTNAGGLDYWGSSAGPILPGAFHNPTSSVAPYGTAVLNPGQLALHPGQVGEYAIARFTAPIAGTYTFSADFIGLDLVFGTTTDVHLLVNSSSTPSVFSGAVNGYLAVASSGVHVMTLAPNETIDAVVGFGANGNFYGDTTGLDFNVSYVPTPATGALAVAAGLLASRRRRE